MLYLVPFVVFIGFIAGAILKHVVPEEVEPGERYFVLVERLLLFLIAFVASASLENTLLSYILFVSGLLMGFFIREPYLLFGAAMTSFNFLLGTLIFLFGIPFGKRKNVAKNAILFASPFILLLIPINTAYMLTIVSGACVALAFRYKR